MLRTTCLITTLLAIAACGDSEVPRLPIDAPAAPIDANLADPTCATCGANEICVQKFNGTCGRFATECQPRDPACTGTACSTACDVAQCRGGMDGGILTCFAAGCAGEDPAALHCYGP
jgi:hypothetical protein